MILGHFLAKEYAQVLVNCLGLSLPRKKFG